MNYRIFTEDMLRSFRAKQAAVENLQRTVDCLLVEDRLDRERLEDGAGPDSAKQQRLGNRVFLCETRKRLEAAKTEVAQVERALSLLSETEKKVIYLLYVDRRRRAVDELMEALCYEKSNIYKIRDRALLKLTIALYGAVED